MIDTNEPLSREELALFYSRMNEEFAARNESIKGLLAKVNSLGNLCNAKIDKVIKAVNSGHSEFSEQEKRDWITAAENVLNILSNNSLSDYFYTLDCIIEFMSIIDISITDELFNDSFNKLDVIADDAANRQLFEDIVDFIMRKRFPERFGIFSYKSEITKFSELDNSDTSEVIEDNAGVDDTESPESHVSDEKANYRSVPKSVESIISNYALNNNLSFTAATTKLYKAIERKTGTKLSATKKQFREDNTIPYCTTAYMISRLDYLFELLKQVAQEL